MRVAILIATLTVAACHAGSDTAPGPPCTTDSDCPNPNTMVCEFPATAGCATQGVCGTFPTEQTECGGAVLTTGCDCAGVTTVICVSGGYVLGAPVRGLGSCAGEDAGDGSADGSPGSAPDGGTG